jgi:penicillin-binding protein 1C
VNTFPKHLILFWFVLFSSSLSWADTQTLQLHSKLGPKKLLIWVLNRGTGKPVPKAEVKVRGCHHLPVLLGRSDKDGLVTFSSRDCLNDMNNLFVTARSGPLSGSLTGQELQELEPWRFNIDRTPFTNIRSHVILPKKTYRPGEIAYFKIIATSAFPLPVTLQFRHAFLPYSRELNLKQGRHGSYFGQLMIPKDAPPGTYDLKRNQQILGSLTVVTSKEQRFLTGLSIENGIVKIEHRQSKAKTITVRAYFTIPRERSELFFQDGYQFYTQPIQAGILDSGQVCVDRLDSREYFAKKIKISGHSPTYVRLPKPQLCNSPRTLIVETEIEGVDGTNQLERASELVLPGEEKLGLKAQQKEGADLWVVDGLLLNRQGLPVTGRKIKLESYQLKHYVHRKLNLHRSYDYGHQLVALPPKTVCEGETNQQGRFTCESAVTPGSSLFVQATTEGSAARILLANQSHTLSNLKLDQSPALSLKAVATQQGIVVRFFSPFRDAYALVSHEGRDLVSHEVKEVGFGENSIEIKNDVTDSNGGHVSVFLRGSSGSEKFGLAKVAVHPSYGPELKLELKPNGHLQVNLNHAEPEKVDASIHIAESKLTQNLTLPTKHWLRSYHIWANATDLSSERMINTDTPPSSWLQGQLEVSKNVTKWFPSVRFNQRGVAEVVLPQIDNTKNYEIQINAHTATGEMFSSTLRVPAKEATASSPTSLNSPPLASLPRDQTITIEVASGSSRLQDTKQNFPPSYEIYLDHAGILLGWRRTNFQRRQFPWLSLQDLTPVFTQLLLKAEDKNFFAHQGVDWPALLNVAKENLSPFNDDPPRGASTLTMQLARLLKHARADKNKYTSKISQVLAAQKIEEQWSKQEILEAYVNLAPSRGDLVGIFATSMDLFNKHPRDLSKEEAAIIVVLLRAPNAAQGIVVQRVLRLLDTPFSDALAGQVKQALQLRALQNSAMNIVTLVHPDSVIKNKNGIIQTTLVHSLQTASVRLLNRHIDLFKVQNMDAGAIVVLDSVTKNILAYVPHPLSPSKETYFDYARAPHQVGSTMKPFIYAYAMEKGLINLNTSILDNEIDVPLANSMTYTPRNHNKAFAGEVTVAQALGSSLNIPAIKVASLLDEKKLIERLRAFGLTDIAYDHPYGEGFALGSSSASLLQMTKAFTHLQDNSFRQSTRKQIAKALAEPNYRLLSFGADNPLRGGTQASVKTGTSNDMRDTWAVGWSSGLTIGLWLGNSLAHPMGNLGSMNSALLWQELVQAFSILSPKKYIPQAFENDTTISKSPKKLRPLLIFPVNGMTYWIDHNQEKEAQRLIFVTSDSNAIKKITKNGMPIEKTNGLYSVAMTPGRYSIEVHGQDDKVVQKLAFRIK